MPELLFPLPRLRCGPRGSLGKFFFLRMSLLGLLASVSPTSLTPKQFLSFSTSVVGSLEKRPWGSVELETTLAVLKALAALPLEDPRLNWNLPFHFSSLRV